jgi:hypothetical protein
MKIPLIVLLTILSLALAACAPAGTMTPAPAATDSPQSGGGSDGDPVTREPLATPTADPIMAGIVLKVKADLAARAGLDPDLIEALNSEPVTWPDASLGCPEPGQSYAQVLSPGYLILLKAGREIYQYHTDDRGDTIMLCDPGANSPFPPMPVTPGEIEDGEPWLPVD